MYIFLSFIHQNIINNGICLQLYMKFQYQWRFQIFAITCIEREKYCIHATDEVHYMQIRFVCFSLSEIMLPILSFFYFTYSK